jgi:hypothetical protein
MATGESRRNCEKTTIRSEIDDSVETGLLSSATLLLWRLNTRLHLSKSFDTL